MKKLSVILSVLLCLSAMVTGVSAESTGEVLTGGDALAIYEKCVNKMGKAEYLEIREYGVATGSVAGPGKVIREVADYKLAVAPDGKLQGEREVWDASGERIEHFFIDGDYLYDRMEQKKYWSTSAENMRGQIYVLTGTAAWGYKDDLENINAEKIEGGYRLNYRIDTGWAYYDKYTMIINDDFMLESATNIYSYSSGPDRLEEDNKVTYKYEILSINRPFKIKFPPDLSSYKLF